MKSQERRFCRKIAPENGCTPSCGLRWARWLSVILVILSLFLLAVAWWETEARKGPQLSFIAFEERGDGDVLILFRLRNEARWDWHYRIETLPSLIGGAETSEAGLLPAKTVVTNRIPFTLYGVPFRLRAKVYRLPILPRQWYRRPQLSWRCVEAFLRGQSRLMFSFSGELPTNRGFVAETPSIPGYESSDTEVENP